MKVRPPLKKSLFPIQRVTRIKASREAGNFFFFIYIFFYIVKNKENTQKQRKKSLNLKKTTLSALIGSPGRWTGNKVIFKGGLRGQGRRGEGREGLEKGRPLVARKETRGEALFYCQ